MPLVTHAHVSESRRYASGVRTGTRTAADFTITLGFDPKVIRVTNLTDKITAEHFVDSNLGTANAESLLTIATGVRTYVAAGISISNRSFTVDVSVANLETDNDETVWEAWG